MGRFSSLRFAPLGKAFSHPTPQPVGCLRQPWFFLGGKPPKPPFTGASHTPHPPLFCYNPTMTQRPNTPQEYSVSSLARELKSLVETEFDRVRVKGEIGRVTNPQSGHTYLDLKDDKAVLACVIWKQNRANITLKPETGQEVICSGRLSTFAGQSRYQLVIENISFAGEGALLAEMEKLRKKLFQEGLFDETRKKPLPLLPQRIGVITSPTGAVIRDIAHRVRDRSGAHLLLWPVRVQGKESAGEITEAIKGFNALPKDGRIPRPDLLIIARGGGSLEDLWPFNDETLLREAAKSAIPIISAIGHETDRMLLDEAADLRAPTPTAAAEFAVPQASELREKTQSLAMRGEKAIASRLARLSERLRFCDRGLARGEALLRDREQRLDGAALRLPKALQNQILLRRRHFQAFNEERMRRGIQNLIAQARRRFQDTARLEKEGARLILSKRERLRNASRVLESLSYERVLERGYALAMEGDGRVMRHPEKARPGDDWTLRFAKSVRVAVRVRQEQKRLI